MSRFYEGDRVRFAAPSRDRREGNVLEYSPVGGCELDVLISWEDGTFNWEKASTLVVIS